MLNIRKDILNMKNFRKNVRFLRKQNGYTLEQFANILGVSKSLISQFESCFSGISLDVMIKIRSLFNVTLDDLIFKDLTKK
jgi:transcriptional regulator with XRE-family HTH domain